MTKPFPVKAPKKLIEVALPLDVINKAARDEKAVPRPGHPQTMHYWWATLQLCLVAARDQASRVTGEVRKLDHDARES